MYANTECFVDPHTLSRIHARTHANHRDVRSCTEKWNVNKPLEAAIQFENVVNEQRHKARVREIDVIGIDYAAIYDLVISVVVLLFRSHLWEKYCLSLEISMLNKSIKKICAPPIDVARFDAIKKKQI